jgi:hypothetical protein
MSNIAVLALLLAGPAASQGTTEGRGPEKRFISQRYAFSMAVPVGWGVSTGLDTPVYFYAPHAGRFIQDRIPQSGAVITVESHDAMSGDARSATTPQALALASTRALASGVPPIEPFRFSKESGASDAVTSSYDEANYSPDLLIQHSIAVFWQFGSKLFAAHLNYNANDPKGPTFRRTFFRTIRSLRPLHIDSRPRP